MKFDKAYDIYLVRLKKTTTRVWKSRRFFVKSYDRRDGNLYDGNVVGNSYDAVWEKRAMRFGNLFDSKLAKLKKAMTRVWQTRHIFMKSYDHRDGKLYDGSVVGNNRGSANSVVAIEGALATAGGV